MLARFQSEHPGVDVRLDVTRDLTKLMDRLHSNEIDLAVMGRLVAQASDAQFIVLSAVLAGVTGWVVARWMPQR